VAYLDRQPDKPEAAKRIVDGATAAVKGEPYVAAFHPDWRHGYGMAMGYYAAERGDARIATGHDDVERAGWLEGYDRRKSRQQLGVHL
jgi:hypothetical protein